jgi:hypothetical protein
MDESVPGPQMIAYLNLTTVLCAQVLDTKSMETIKSITLLLSLSFFGPHGALFNNL